MSFGACASCWLGAPSDQNSQRLDGGAPLAGDDLHELEAAVVELNVRGVVVLRVDLTGPQRAAVLGLEANVELNEAKNSRARKHSPHPPHRPGFNTLYMLLVFFLGFASYTN